MKMSRILALALTLILALGCCTFSFAEEKEPITLTCFVNHSWFWTDEWVGIIPETITEKTGVRLEVTRAVDGQQLGLMIASNDLPDIVYTSEYLDRLSSPELCYSYNELIEQYGLEWEPNSLLVANAKTFSPDDNYYTLLQNFSTGDQWAALPAAAPMLCTLAYRADILEELGNPPMTTMDEFMDVLGMVKEKYPELIPHTFSTVWGMEPFRVWSGMSSGDYMEWEGKVISKIRHPKYLDWLKYCNEMYRNGYIVADNFALEDSDTKAYLQNGMAFSGSYYTQGEVYRYGVMSTAVDPDARLMEAAPMSTEGWYSGEGIGWSGIFITKNNQYPEETIRFMEFMFSEEGQRLSLWGREGIEYTLGEDGMPVFSDEWQAASEDESTLYAKYNPAYAFGAGAVVEAAGRCAVLPDDYRAVYPSITALYRAEPWIAAGKPTGDIEEKVILDKLDDMILNTEPQIILSESEEEVEEKYAEMLKNAESIGIDKLEAYMTESVMAAKANYQ